MLNHMAHHSAAPLNDVFGAIADPTRRAIMEHLGHNSARVTDIAKNFPISLNAVSKHLMVLERAGLIRREVHGRDHICNLNLQPLRGASAWIEGVRAFWETRLDAFERHVARKRRNLP
jgi:DNA-binding transcriptional ArsR family regulator